jgi:predicted MFS family arabinose efflux permease
MLLQLTVIGLGPANGPPAYTRAVNQSFDRSRGLALGVALASTGLMALVAPPALAWVIQTHGWRSAYLALALVTVVSAPIVLGLLSRCPRPDPRAAPPSQRISLAQALRNTTFLRLLAAFALAAVGIGGVSLHLVPILTDDGYSLRQAAAVQGLIGFSILFGRLAAGFLVDRFFAPRVAALAITAAALGLLLLAALGGRAAPVAAVLAGLAMGAEGDVIGYVTARYFGLPAYGKLYGLLYGAYTAGLGAGAFLLAQMQAAFGGYAAGLTICGCLMLGGALLLAGAPRFAPAPLPTQA